MMKVAKILSIVIISIGIIVPTVYAQVTKDNLDQNADQSQGNYAATNLNYLGGGGSLGMMQSAWKDPLQHMGEGQTRPGYTKYYWTPELVLPVRVREGMYTLINFPNWEVIENVYIGDGQSFNAEIQGPSSLMVYPDSSQFVGVDTNMIVFGRSGNKYVFYVQSETVNTDRITNAIIDIEVVKRRQNATGSAVIGSNNGGGHINANAYGQNGSSADATFTRDLQKEDWIEKIPVDPTKFRFDIEVYVPNPDDIVIAPERVWRDNIFTYIDLGDKALTANQRPIVTLIVERSETPVGFRTAGPNNRLIIVEGMGDMVLRSGKRIVCLKLRRSDSDGLENTVYAKTNEWDLQAKNYQRATEGKESNTESYENVYTGDVQKENNQKKSFFGISSFFGGSQNTDSSTTDTNGLSYEDMISGKKKASGQQSEKASNVENTTPQDKIKPQTNIESKTEETALLNSIPKAKTYVASPTPQESGIELTGQYDTKADGAELVTPQYENKADISVSYQKDVQQNTTIPESVKQNASTQVGVSSNNSSPVLITPKDESLEKQNSLVNAETEALLKEFRDGRAFSNADENNISIELGTDKDVNNLEKLWNDISKNYSATLGKYQPFYSVDTPADGQGKEVFHLRVGPVKSLDEGDNICSQLGRNGIFCSVVRIQ